MTHRSRLALAASLLLGAAGVRAAGEFKSHGFLLPAGAVKVDDDRFRLPQTWEEALRYYRTSLPPAQYPRRALHSQSGVRALHIVNPQGDEWEGANLYELPKGEVRVYVLARKQPAAGSGDKALPGPARKPRRRGSTP